MTAGPTFLLNFSKSRLRLKNPGSVLSVFSMHGSALGEAKGEDSAGGPDCSAG